MKRGVSILLAAAAITAAAPRSAFAGGRITYSASVYSPAGTVSLDEDLNEEGEVIRNKLTVDKALDYALQNSGDVKRGDEDAYLAVEKHHTLYQAFTESMSTDSMVSALVALTRNEMEQSMAYPEREDQKEALRASITRYFQAVLSAERALALYDEKIELDKKELAINEVKLRLGQISQADFDSAKTAYGKSLSERKTREKAIEDAYKNLSDIMGVSRQSRYEPVIDLPYSPFNMETAKAHIETAADASLSVKKAEENLKVLDYQRRINIYKDDYDIESADIELERAKRDLADLRDKFKDDMTALYDEIKEEERSIGLLEADLAEKEKALEITRTKLKLGKASQFEADKAEYEVKSLRADLQNKKEEHGVDVLRFKQGRV
ncbi:MAG: TolC family protein [Clostridiales bacterium]|jgi:outer membrane protein TolC|nr:TolC family protein [Clostridiales bacterium]